MSRTPETTSSPWALGRKSPEGSGAPVISSRLKATPEPDVVALVAEHHLLHVDGGAPLVGDVVQAPVLDRALAVPGVEHRPDRLAQLLARVVRELLAGPALEDPLEVAAKRRRSAASRSVSSSTPCFSFSPLDRLLEHLRRRCRARRCRTSARSGGRSPRRTARSACARRALAPTESLRPRFRTVSSMPGIDSRAPERTDTSSGSSGSPRRLPVCSSSRATASSTCRSRPAGKSPVAHVGDAGLGRDREPVGDAHRAADPRHLGDVGALSAEQVAHLARPLGEVVDPLRHSARTLCHAAQPHVGVVFERPDTARSTWASVGPGRPGASLQRPRERRRP